MAESKNTKTAAAKKPAAGKKSGSGTATVTATAASKAPAGKTAKSPAKKSAKKNTYSAKNTVVKSTAAAKKPAPKKPAPQKKDDAQQAAKVRQRSTFSEQFLPYIFGGLALIFSVLFLLNAIGGAAAPEEHLMGYVGFYLCQALFGCFGWAAYLIPLVFVNLAVFWRRYCEERLVAVKLILSVLLMVMISSVIHVGVCTSDPSLAKTFNAGYLYRTGAVFESGGIVGGVVGNLLYTGLRLPGTVVLSVVALPLIL
ncbi:MAG: DNA translocase FtsK 4TM domain-containing protein, partial [Clostridia bacterium]|nr:DNA translocase FtsK 4TM domain-containing protein [Clostridia bacterium]